MKILNTPSWEGDDYFLRLSLIIVLCCRLLAFISYLFISNVIHCEKHLNFPSVLWPTLKVSEPDFDWA